MTLAIIAFGFAVFHTAVKYLPIFEEAEGSAERGVARRTLKPQLAESD